MFQFLHQLSIKTPATSVTSRRKSSSGRKATVCGFSLVELLVTILIIAALAAITFVVLGRAKRNSYMAGSMNNLRQLGAAGQAIAADFNGILPVTTWESPDRGVTLMYWWDPSGEYLFSDYNYKGPQRKRRINGLFRDPASPEGKKFDCGEFREPKWAEISYVVWSPSQKNWDQQVRGTRLVDLSNPSMQPYLTTGIMPPGNLPAITSEAEFKAKVLPSSLWHDNRIIVIYCDGRVEVIAQPTFEKVAPLMARAKT